MPPPSAKRISKCPTDGFGIHPTFQHKNLCNDFFLKLFNKNNYNIPILSGTIVQTDKPRWTAKQAKSCWCFLDETLSLPQKCPQSLHLDSYKIQFSTDPETKWYIRRVNTVSSLPFFKYSIKRKKQHIFMTLILHKWFLSLYTHLCVCSIIFHLTLSYSYFYISNL